MMLLLVAVYGGIRCLISPRFNVHFVRMRDADQLAAGLLLRRALVSILTQFVMSQSWQNDVWTWRFLNLLGLFIGPNEKIRVAHVWLWSLCLKIHGDSWATLAAERDFNSWQVIPSDSLNHSHCLDSPFSFTNAYHCNYTSTHKMTALRTRK